MRRCNQSTELSVLKQFKSFLGFISIKMTNNLKKKAEIFEAFFFFLADS